MTARQVNLLGALALALDDRLQAAVQQKAGRGGQSSAALAVLGQQDGLGIEGLRVQLGLSQPATVRLVDGLVADGLVERRAGRDARSLSLALTGKGRRRATAVLAARRAAIEDALRPLSATERGQLEALLEKMLGAVTPDRLAAEVICRLCELGACPQDRCPVECAAGDA